jgi:chromosome segregation ATPase
MWPRLLLEILPHLSRLVPAADTYLSTRRKSDEALQAALTSLGDEVRSGFAKAAENQGARDRELEAQIAALKDLAAQLTDARGATEHLETRLAAVEGRLLMMTGLLWALLALLVCGAAVVAFRALH